MRRLVILLLLFAALLHRRPLAAARPVILLLSKTDADDHSDPAAAADEEPSDGDEFPDPDLVPDDLLDPGSWRSVVEPESPSNSSSSSLPSPSHPDPDPDSISAAESLYLSGVHKMFSAVASSDPRSLEGAAAEIDAAARAGHPHAQSTLAFFFGSGTAKETDLAKAFLYHHFAAEGGNMQSKMAVAYTFLRQELYEKSVKLYAELADAALASFQVSGDLPVIDPVRLHSGVEENKDALRKSRGEEDEDFQIAEYQAQKGNSAAMYKIGIYYYYGLRGVRRNHQKALYWFAKAVDKGEPRSLELLGEIYARGAGVERDYKKALDCFARASEQKHFSAYNGLGYLYVKGYGVDKNLTKAHELFEKAAKNDEPGGFYNLGMLYFKGIGVKRNIILASEHITKAAGAGQPKAVYQLAKMFQAGVGFKKDLKSASHLFKVVAERGPWSSLSRWALACYLKGEVGKALLLYSRMAEMGYEVAQSNAAWILDKYGERSMCMGELGLCTDAERDQRSHSLWWQASEQGNEHAALLIGDAYYYGRGTERDYERAAEAYVHAQLQSNAQAMFNLGYMHEHGQGRPLDLHLAKRYYDQALETDPAAKLPVSLALMSLWIRKNYENSFLIHVIDSLPEAYPKVKSWIDEVILDEGNATILTLFACLLTVLYLRDRQRRQVVQPPPQPNDVAAN